MVAVQRAGVSAGVLLLRLARVVWATWRGGVQSARGKGQRAPLQSGGFIHKRIDSRTRAQKSGLVIT